MRTAAVIKRVRGCMKPERPARLKRLAVRSLTLQAPRGGSASPKFPAGSGAMPRARRRRTRGPQMLGQDPAFLREAAKVEDVSRCDESIERHLMELAARWFEMERRIDVRAGVADKEQGLREEPVGLARRPLRETRRRIGGEHLGLRPDRLGEVDDAGECDGPRFRHYDL